MQINKFYHIFQMNNNYYIHVKRYNKYKNEYVVNMLVNSNNGHNFLRNINICSDFFYEKLNELTQSEFLLIISNLLERTEQEFENDILQTTL